MSEWIEYKLEDLGLLQRGRSRHRPRYAFHLFGGKYPFIQTGEIREARKYIDKYEQTYNETGLEQSKLWQKGTLCITIAANIAELGILKFDACFPDSVLGFTPNKDKVNLDFIYYTLVYFQRELKHAGEGSVQDNINLGTFKDIYFPIPLLEEQKAIAEVLSSLDDKIDLLHRQNKTLEELAQTLFRQWFIEEAKDEWEEIKIKDFDIVVTDYVANGSFKSLKENVTLVTENEDFALFIRNTDLKSGFTKKVFVTEHSYNFLNKTKLYGSEVLISNVADVGSVFRCPKFDIPMTLGNNMIMLNSKYNLFFYLFFQSEYGQNLIYGITSGSVQQKFNKTDFRNLAFKIKDENQLIDFENIVKIYYEKIDANIKKIKTLENMRDTLLPKLMSGEVRVKL
jgi:type I restriction enzyme S subunit